MKRIILLQLIFTFLAVTLCAQSTILFNINHKLSSADFAMETATTNNLDHNFEVTRLQYYISGITIYHDGGMEKVMEDTWILVDAAEPTLVDLGRADITMVEKIKFHIGIDPDHNHLDPASYDASHPLAPKFPSMHWGWNPGYRFIAYEGNCGDNLSQVFQLHGLGDINYFAIEVLTTAEAVNDEVVISIDADYTRGLEDLELNSGLIVHDDKLEAQQCLRNFRDYVFSPPGSNPTSTKNQEEAYSFEIFPNPVIGNNTFVTLGALENGKYDILVHDLFGRQVTRISEVQSNATLDLELKESGLYLINLVREGQTVITKKLIVK